MFSCLAASTTLGSAALKMLFEEQTATATATATATE
jgi:hypothetical protein